MFPNPGSLVRAEVKFLFYVLNKVRELEMWQGDMNLTGLARGRVIPCK